MKANITLENKAAVILSYRMRVRVDVRKDIRSYGEFSVPKNVPERIRLKLAVRSGGQRLSLFAKRDPAAHVKVRSKWFRCEAVRQFLGPSFAITVIN